MKPKSTKASVRYPQTDNLAFRSLAQTAKDGIICADMNGHITFFNTAAEEMFGYSSNEILGKSLQRLMPQKYRKKHADGLKRFLTSAKPKLIGRTVELGGRR